MNIWIVNHYAIPPCWGGLVRHYYFSKYLSKKGHHVKIFTSSKIHNTDINMIKGKNLYVEKVMDGVEYTFVRSRDYKGNGLDRIVNMMDFPFRVIRALKVFEKKEKPDVMYISSPDIFLAFFALAYGKKNHIPSIVEVRDLWPESIVAYKQVSRWNPLVPVLYAIEKWIYKKADKLIFTMPGGKQYIRDKKWDTQIDVGKIENINNGVDISEFNTNKELWKLTDSDLEDEKSFKVVYVGSIRYVNHLGTLIDAAGVLKHRNYCNIKILIYGDGTEKEMLEKRCAEEGLNVVFKGRVEKKYIPYILSKSDLNLINVKSAGINRYGCSWNKIFEYMASHKPILSNLKINFDMIEKYHLGVSKNFSSADEYAEAIIEFAEMSPEKYEEYCRNAAKFSELYDYMRLSDKVEAVCSEVCGRNREE